VVVDHQGREEHAADQEVDRRDEDRGEREDLRGKYLRDEIEVAVSDVTEKRSAEERSSTRVSRWSRARWGIPASIVTAFVKMTLKMIVFSKGMKWPIEPLIVCL
jgi:hypothetical protein